MLHNTAISSLGTTNVHIISPLATSSSCPMSSLPSLCHVWTEKRFCRLHRWAVSVSYLLSVDETKLTWSLQHRCRISAGEPVKEVKTAAQAAASRDALARLLYGRLVDSIVNWVNSSFTLTRLLL